MWVIHLPAKSIFCKSFFRFLALIFVARNPSQYSSSQFFDTTRELITCADEDDRTPFNNSNY
jgi:hypothetical protein